MVIVVMGVCGCGKSTIGQMLASELGWQFFDADKFHPVENKEKMRSGIPLNDDDRLPWLLNLANLIDTNLGDGKSIVLACSALKQKYRDILNKGNHDLRVVLLDGSKELITERLKVRSHEYMNPTLLQSQFDTLERPKGALCVDITPPPEDIVTTIRQEYRI